jgi:hypothetical protein
MVDLERVYYVERESLYFTLWKQPTGKDQKACKECTSPSVCAGYAGTISRQTEGACLL